jgi:Zn-dependent peptidase ImmA (M78 family)
MQMRITEMTLRVPYLRDEAIERDAEGLLAQYSESKGVEIRAPIPIEDIVEKHLKLRVEFDDLHRLLDVPRSWLGAEPDIFGAIWLDSGRIVLDESLDPEERPSMEGRYRFTLAHEGGGHWRLHRSLVRSDPDQRAFFDDATKPTVICRSSQSKERVEWQADFYASCLLMPRHLVHAEWEERLGRTKPVLLSDLRPNGAVLSRAERLMHERGRSEVEAVDDALFESVAAPIARQFAVSRAAMRIRLEKLGLLLRADPKQLSMTSILRPLF